MMQSISSITLPTAQELTVETSSPNTPSLSSSVSSIEQVGLREVPSTNINEYINELLSYTDEGFEGFFRDKANAIINYFAACPVWMSLEEWLFHEGNQKHFSYTTKSLINQIYNRSKMLGYSFIKQYNLADKLNITPYHVREIIKKFQSLALIHKGRTNKIHYSLIFDLTTKVTSYIESIVNILFDYYSKNNSPVSTFLSNFTSTFGSLTDFSLVNVVYKGICEIKEASQSKRSKIYKTCKNKEHAGMLESESSSNITDLSFPNEESKSNLTSNVDKLTEVVKTLVGLLSNQLPNTNILDKIATLNISSSNYQSNIEIEQTLNREEIKSRYTLDECEKYTIEYAKGKLGSRDEIRDIRLFAGYCYRSGEHDVWIDIFLRTGKIMPYNPVRDEMDAILASQSNATKDSSKPNNNNKLTNSKTDNKIAVSATSTPANTSASATTSCLGNDDVNSQIVDIINVNGIADVIDIVGVVVESQSVEINEVIEVVQSFNESKSLADKSEKESQTIENTTSNVINIADRLSAKSDNNAKESIANTRKPSFKELYIDTLDPKEIKGKYSFETYVDFIVREETKRMEAKGKAVFSVEGLAKHLYTTGKDDLKVKAFVEKMRNLAVGARPGDLAGLVENKPANSNDNNDNANNSNNNNPNNVVGSVSKYDTNRGKDQQGNGIDFSLSETKESLAQEAAITKLEQEFWQSLDSQQISEITKIALAEYKASYPNDLALLAPDAVVEHVQNRLSRRVAKLAYSTNDHPKTALTNLGTELINSLSDDERAEMIEAFITVFGKRTGINYYKSDAKRQKELLDAIQMDIGINLAIANLIS